MLIKITKKSHICWFLFSYSVTVQCFTINVLHKKPIMCDDNQDDSLRHQFQQLQEQQQKRLQLAQRRRNAKVSKQNSTDGGLDKQTSSFGVTDDMDLKVRK